jgi:hypothetical protein
VVFNKKLLFFNRKQESFGQKPVVFFEVFSFSGKDTCFSEKNACFSEKNRLLPPKISRYSSKEFIFPSITGNFSTNDTDKILDNRTERRKTTLKMSKKSCKQGSFVKKPPDRRTISGQPRDYFPLCFLFLSEISLIAQ